MSALRPRLALIGLFLALVGLAGGLRWWIGARVDGALTARGLAVEGRQDALFSLQRRGLTGPGLRVDSLRLDLLPRPAVRLRGVRVDLAALELDRGGAGSGAAGGPPVGARAEDVTVTYGEDVVAEGLSGELLPALRLEGPGAAISRGADGRVEITLARALSVGPLSGTATLNLRCAADCALTLDLPDAVLSHPRLARRPLDPTPLHLELRGPPKGGTVTGLLRYGEVGVDLSGEVDLDQRALSMTARAADLPFRAVVGLFGAQIPEAAVADLRGTLGAEVTVHGPPFTWTVKPSAADLATDGVIDDVGVLRGGALTWRAPAAEGGWRTVSTGEGSPSWTPLAEAGLVPAAFIAAEDSAFWSHPGYDLGAIEEAIAAAATDPDTLRGGSTISQQLAKNLFLDGNDRTLCRKLRELLFALELERVIGKNRILELYINIVEMGPELYGVAAGADAYFLKAPARLSPREAAFLAAILRSPRSSYERAYLGGRVPNARLDAILQNMGRARVLSPAALERALRGGLLFVPPAHGG